MKFPPFIDFKNLDLFLAEAPASPCPDKTSSSTTEITTTLPLCTDGNGQPCIGGGGEEEGGGTSTTESPTDTTATTTLTSIITTNKSNSGEVSCVMYIIFDRELRREVLNITM